MILSEVLQKISPCNTQKPYIFISYSSQDKELVWPDVLEFQNQGYNVWLDEKNLDKTKASWKDDALLAIEDMYCMLVVFYVSKYSLISEACYNELAKTTDEFSIALHDGPIKFIAIDVDDVGNIGEFTGNLHQSVFQNPELSKEDKSKMLLTLHKFKKEFFDSNNERVRVHPKNEPNRKMNYYDEIIATFPDLTCDFEKRDRLQQELLKKQQETAAAQAEAEAKLRAEAEAKIRAEAEAMIRAEAEAKIRAEAEAKLRAEAEAKLRAELEKKIQAESAVKIQSEPAEKAEADTSLPEADTSFPKANQHFTRENILAAMKIANSNPGEKEWNKFLSVLEAGEKKISNALKSYGKTLSVSDIVGLHDSTLFGSAKEGFLITHRGLYSDAFRKGQYLEFDKLQGFEPGRKEYYLNIFYTDGTKEEFFVASAKQSMIIAFLNALLAQR